MQNVKAQARANKAAAAKAASTVAPVADAAPVAAPATALAAPAAATVAASPRLTESDVQRLFAHLAATDSCPIKIGTNRGKNSSEPLLAPHARVGVSARNVAAILFAAIAQNIEIKAGAVIPRFFTYADTPLHIECGAGRNFLRGVTDKKSGAVTLAGVLSACDTGDAFTITDKAAPMLSLIAPKAVKAFSAALAAYA